MSCRRTCRAPAAFNAANHIYNVSPKDGTAFCDLRPRDGHGALIGTATSSTPQVHLARLGHQRGERPRHLAYLAGEDLDRHADQPHVEGGGRAPTPTSFLVVLA